jgi:hypothetical protein
MTATTHGDHCARQNVGYTRYVQHFGQQEGRWEEMVEWWVCNACGTELAQRVTRR